MLDVTADVDGMLPAVVRRLSPDEIVAAKTFKLSPDSREIIPKGAWKILRVFREVAGGNVRRKHLARFRGHLLVEAPKHVIENSHPKSRRWGTAA